MTTTILEWAFYTSAGALAGALILHIARVLRAEGGEQ